MNHPEPNITVNVDLTNPGQFFACCGLLELADRLWPGAEGWFTERHFHIVCEGSIEDLLRTLTTTTINSSVTDEGLKRLGTLLSAKKTSLGEKDKQDKDMLRRMWQQETLCLGSPFNLLIDWWRDERSERTPLKTWAAKQLIVDIVRPLLQGVKAISDSPPFNDILGRAVEVSGLPLYFDSHAQCQSTAIDTGFSLYDLRTVLKADARIKPAIDFFAFVGMQRFQPQAVTKTMFRYFAWRAPLPVAVASVVARGRLRMSSEHYYEFRLLHRTKYMKAFLPATPIGASL